MNNIWSLQIARCAWVTAALGMLVAAVAAQPSPAATVPPDSIYNLDIRLEDQGGRSFRLAELRGKEYIVSMFYSSCPYTCPTLIETAQMTLAKLPPDARPRALLISFDVKRDTVAVLERVAREHGLDSERWTLARTDAASVRKLAAALGIQYRELPDGDFNHSTRLLLVDRDGRIVGRTDTMGEVDPGFLARLRALAL